MDRYPPAAQRAALLQIMPALGCSDTALRRDECGDPRLEGKHGHIYAVCGSLHEPGKPGFMAYVSCETAMAWTYAKKALSFAKVTNDGDDEGAIFLGRLPSKSEAEMIRRYCGILKKRDMGDALPSEAQLAARAAFADRRRARSHTSPEATTKRGVFRPKTAQVGPRRYPLPPAPHVARLLRATARPTNRNTHNEIA